MTGTDVKSVLVCGSGLAFELTLAALRNALPEKITIIAMELDRDKNTDDFYGHVTAPTAYNFLVQIGLDEPTLLRGTQTNFAYGTAFEGWAGRLNWVQGYQQPFPVWNNVLFHHYAACVGAPLAPFLISSSAGLNGRFAHPPQEKDNPLSRAEYGYVFMPDEISSLLKSASKLRRSKGTVQSIQSKSDQVKSITTSEGEILEADFFIDCSGTQRQLSSSLDAEFDAEIRLAVKANHVPVTPGFTLKHIKAAAMGWQSTVRLQEEQIHLSVGLPQYIKDPDFYIETGHLEKAWNRNTVAIGHSACVMEPLTPAPMILLQRDIERLLSLFPVTTDMSVEAREYNRLFEDDRNHCALFTRNLFEIEPIPECPYWEAVLTSPCPEKLARKIKQFESRGYLTQYDLEPFTIEDWAIQHFGLGRRPQRQDVFLNQISDDDIKKMLLTLKTNIETMVQKMPPGDRYISKFKAYLDNKHGA